LVQQGGLEGNPHERLLNPLGLNITEIELSVLHQQCLKRRLGNAQTLEQELAAWQQQRN
jgi:hypothetical protein